MDTDPSRSSSFSLRSSLDLVALVPVVLGFHPEESVVLMTFGGAEPADGLPDGRAGRSFHARVDLPVDDAGWAEVTGQLMHAVRANPPAVAAVVVFSRHAERALQQSIRLVAALDGAGVDVLDVLRADGRRYFRVGERHDLGAAYDLRSHRFTAADVLAGNRRLGSRAELVASLVGGESPAERADRLTVLEAVGDLAVALPREAGARREALLRQVPWLRQRVAMVQPPERTPPEECARLLVLLAHEETREVVWSQLDRPTARAQLPLWTDLVRRAPSALVPGVAAMLAFAAWLAGDGALAWCAVERCTGIEPDQPLAAVVARELESATSPDTWSPLPLTALTIFATEPDPLVAGEDPRPETG